MTDFEQLAQAVIEQWNESDARPIAELIAEALRLAVAEERERCAKMLADCARQARAAHDSRDNPENYSAAIEADAYEDGARRIREGK